MASVWHVLKRVFQYEERMGMGEVTVRRLGDAGDLGWVVMAHGELYRAEYGWDASFEALVARIVAAYGSGHDSEREAAWVAELDGRRVGCVFCVAADAEADTDTDTGADGGMAKLRLLLVDPGARGLGVGSRLVETCLDFARTAGYRRMTLWTNDVLTSARRIYQAAGFTLTDEHPHHSFGHDLVGQNWTRDL
jgi:GNAT superfamily N-acetyltransferase